MKPTAVFHKEDMKGQSALSDFLLALWESKNSTTCPLGSIVIAILRSLHKKPLNLEPVSC